MVLALGSAAAIATKKNLKNLGLYSTPRSYTREMVPLSREEVEWRRVVSMPVCDLEEALQRAMVHVHRLGHAKGSVQTIVRDTVRMLQHVAAGEDADAQAYSLAITEMFAGVITSVCRPCAIGCAHSTVPTLDQVVRLMRVQDWCFRAFSVALWRSIMAPCIRDTVCVMLRRAVQAVLSLSHAVAMFEHRTPWLVEGFKMSLARLIRSCLSDKAPTVMPALQLHCSMIHAVLDWEREGGRSDADSLTAAAMLNVIGSIMVIMYGAYATWSKDLPGTYAGLLRGMEATGKPYLSNSRVQEIAIGHVSAPCIPK